MVLTSTVLVYDALHALVLLAEIVARWPASQRRLHRRVEGTHGLKALAATVDDNVRWDRAAAVRAHRGPAQGVPRRSAGDPRGVRG
ncbi:hypothetical protein [Lentzea kentuckyensis]|uniref:hypothetical protein n=1 Tax=Lentzea kentuckyensis TaxID=360086 RepID=UPI000A3AC615|nr:hypothetical protein [Lentzea kentuckyensis]